MQQIENYNCIDLCCEKYCDNHITQFQVIFLNGMKIIISLCDKHAEEWINNFLKNGGVLI